MKIIWIIIILLVLIFLFNNNNKNNVENFTETNLFTPVPKKIINKYENNFDIVITWVDWSNKNFKKKLLENGGTGSFPEEGEFLELKYLIRSLIKHKIKFRKIFVVHSDNHPPPKYLKKNDKRLIFIPHSKIAKNKSDLPLIHRESITINLHRIPGLLENYFYVEDDMFIHNPNIFYKQLEFFENKKQIVFTTNLIKKEQTNPEISMGLWRLNIYNSNNIFKKYKFDENNKPLKYVLFEDHNIWLYNKKIVNEIEKKYDVYFKNTSSYQDIKNSKDKEKYYIGIQNIYINYLKHIKNFKSIKNPKFVSSIHTNDNIFEIKNNKISKNTIPKLLNKLNKYEKYMFSNIQGPGFSDEYPKIPEINKIIYKWLNKLYPQKSEFEIIQENFSNSINQNAKFLDFYEHQIKKTNLIERNEKFFKKHFNHNRLRCSWEKNSLEIRPKYEYTLDHNKNHIRAKNYFNKILTEKLRLLNFATDGNLISAVRGRGYLNDKEISYGDDMDPQAFAIVPKNIVKNRSIKIMKNMFPKHSPEKTPKTKEDKDRVYREKIAVIYTIYRFIKDSDAIYTHYDNTIEKPKNDDINVYLKVKLYSRYCIKGWISERKHFCPVDFIIDDKKSFHNYLRVYGPIRLCNVEGQDVNCLEGSHKYLQNRYGPTYMIPLYAYSYDWPGGKKAPFIDEWNKEWSNTEFKKKHADPKFWEKENQKYLKQKWTAKKFN